MPRRILTDHSFEGGARPTGVPDPADDSDAVPKSYVDAVSTEIDDLPTLDTSDPTTFPVTTPVADPLVTIINLDKAARTGWRLITSGTATTLSAADRTVICTNVSADRTLTLPAANAVAPGTGIYIADGDGTVSTTERIFIAAHAGDSLMGALFGVLQIPGSWHAFISDGVSAWAIVETGADPDVTLAANSDTHLATQKAVKAYVDGTVEKVANMDHTIGAAARQVTYTSISTDRTLTLPLAADVPPGHEIAVYDTSGDCSPTKRIFVTVTSPDTMVNGFLNTAILQRSGSWLRLVSDGVSVWFSLELKADPDATLAANSDAFLPTQKAIKTYVDGAVQSVANTTATIAAATKVVRVTSISTDRVLTLPAANAVPNGYQILVYDASGDCSPTKQILTTVAGSDTMVNGVAGTTSVLRRAYSWTRLVSNGVDKWFSAELAASTDGTFAGASDAFLASQLAIKTYVDTTVASSAAATARTTFSDADKTVLASHRFVAQIGTLSADRTVTLPAANAVPAGYEVTVTDESGTCGENSLTGFRIFVVGAGSDTIRVPTFPAATTDELFFPYDSRTYRSNGSDQWTATNPGVRSPLVWYSHLRNISIPSGIWTPLPWNHVYLDTAGLSPQYTATTTIASGSNAAVLPQSTINVADTSDFTATGWIEVVIGGVGTLARYTGKTATTFTGCNASPFVGISTGTLATGQTVEQAFVGFPSPLPSLFNSIYGVSFSKNAVGYRALRVSSILLGVKLSFGNSPEVPALNIDNQHLQMTIQSQGNAVGTTADAGYIEVFQDSGSVLQSTVDGFTTPIVMQDWAGGN